MNRPPRIALRFLHWYCKPELLEEIEGDIYELYQQRLEKSGQITATLYAVWDVLRFFRRSNLRSFKTQNYNIMTGNYIKTGWRNFRNHPASSFINVSGLMLGIGCMITVFIFQDYFLNMDTFHTKRDRIYQVLNHISGDGETHTWSDISMPLYDMLAGSSQVEHISRIEFIQANIRFERDVFRENIWMVDPDYMEIFDFPLRYGDKNALKDKHSIVLTEPMAQKYFGDLDPMGKVLQLKFNDSTMMPFTVTAVMEKIPERASFGGYFLISTEVFKDLYPNSAQDWTYLTDAIFLTLREGSDNTSLDELLNSGIALQNRSTSTWTTKSYEMAPLADLPNRGTEIQSAISGGSNPDGRIALTITGIMLLVLACINYVNIAVAYGTRRLREIALRKVMGGVRSQIIIQFMVENLILCFIALVGGILLAYFLLLPGFNKMLPVTIPFEFSDVFTAIGFFCLLLVFVALVSGAYPSIYVARFKPVSIFRGKEKFGSTNIFAKLLMTLQLFIAFTTIVACFIFNDNALRMADRDWGYDEEDVISVPVANVKQLEFLAANAGKRSDVAAVSKSNGHIGHRNPLTQITRNNRTTQAYVYQVDPDYLTTMGLRLLKGSWFDANSSSSSTDMVITEEAARRLDLEDPLESTIVYDSTEYKVIGVLEDFHQEIFYMDILPAFFIRGSAEDMQYVSVRATPGNQRDVLEAMSVFWKEIAPDDPFEGFQQAEVMDIFFRENTANIVILTAISLISLFLASLGLYGLVSFQVQRRLKELSIRKVLGATIGDISGTINRSYIWMLLTAFVLGVPIGYLMIHQLIIHIYPDPEPTSFRPFIVAVLVVLGAVALTLGSQLIRVSRENPADLLRTD